MFVGGVLALAAIMIFLETFYTLAIPSLRRVRVSFHMFAVLSYGVSWVIRGQWRNVLDEVINDMGPMELDVFMAQCEQVKERKYSD